MRVAPFAIFIVFIAVSSLVPETGPQQAAGDLRWLDARDFAAADPRRASPRAFALTAVLFASEHSLWFAGLVAGLLYNWLYKSTGNLWVAIASHAIPNGALGIWILATANWRLW